MHMPLMTVLGRGAKRRCPNCGEGGLFKSYLKLVSMCPSCGEKLGHIRADDAPPYITITIVAHVMVPLLLISEKNIVTPIWLSMLVGVLVALCLTLWIMPHVKGAVAGYMWRLGLRGDEYQ